MSDQKTRDSGSERSKKTVYEAAADRVRTGRETGFMARGADDGSGFGNRNFESMRAVDHLPGVSLVSTHCSHQMRSGMGLRRRGPV